MVAQVETPYCLERLEEQVKKINGSEDIPEAQYRRLMVDFAACFISVGRKWVRTETQVIELKEIIQERSRQHRAENGNKKVEDSDTFKKLLIYFRDKILPDLIKLIIVGGVGWLLAVNDIIRVTVP